MSITQIQEEVLRLSDVERRQLTSWMVSEFPVLRVEDLMAKASQSVEKGEWHPKPPGAENVPSGKVLEHAKRVAARLGLLK